jgi:glycosyltransferase involved in cell wall biosynthesis
MPQDTPLVSVVIAAYNAEKYIQQTIDSILAQTFCDYEIIVVDDGSTDATKEILACYGERIRYCYLQNSGGPAKPRNVGIRMSRAKYIALFDHDDVMVPDKLKKQVACLEKHPEVSLVFSDFLFWDGNAAKGTMLERESTKKLFERILRQSDGTALLFKRPIYDELLRGNFIGTSTIVVRREDILGLGGFDESLVGIDDLDLYLKLSHQGKLFACIQEQLNYYRVFEQSLTYGLKTSLSQLQFWERMLRTEPKSENRKIARIFLFRTSFSIGYWCSKRAQWLDAACYYFKSLQYSSWNNWWRSVSALLTLPLHWMLNIRKKS